MCQCLPTAGNKILLRMQLKLSVSLAMKSNESKRGVIKFDISIIHFFNFILFYFQSSVELEEHRKAGTKEI